MTLNERADHDILIDGRPFILYWHAPNETPGSQHVIEQPDTQVLTAVAPNQAGGKWDERDDPYPRRLIINNWQGGAGQRSYDMATSLGDRFWDSRNIEVAAEGRFFLGPYTSLLAATYLDTELIVGPHPSGGYTIWASFLEEDTGDYVDQVRYAATLPDDPADTITWTAAPLPSTLVSRCTALAADDTYVYAAFSDGSAGNGSVYYSKLDGSSEWSLYSDTPNVVALCCSGGYLWAAIDGNITFTVDSTPTTVDMSGVGNFKRTFSGGAESGWSFNLLSPTSFYKGTSLGIAPALNGVFWATCAGHSTKVYHVKDSDETPFSHVTTLTDGFVGTCIASYLEQCFIGGWYKPGFDASVDGADDYRGAVYMTTMDGSSHVFTIGGDAEIPTELQGYGNQVVSITAFGRYLYVVTKAAVYKYAIGGEGGYWHFCSLPTVELDPLPESEPTWEAGSYVPMEGGYDFPEDDGWTRTLSDPEAIKEGPEILAGGFHLGVKDGEYVRYLKADASLTGDGTFEVALGGYEGESYPYLKGEGLEVQMRTSVVEWRLRMQGWQDDSDQWWMRLRLGMWNVHTSAWEFKRFDFKQTYDSGASRPYVVRCPFTSGRMQLWVDGQFIDSSTQGKPITASLNRIYLNFGFPDTDAKDGVREEAVITYFKWSSDDAFLPVYIPVERSMGAAAFLEGKLYVCLPEGTETGKLSASWPDLYASAPTLEDELLYADPCRLELSSSSTRQSSVRKRFWSLDIVHDPLLPGELIGVEVRVDGGPPALRSVIAYDEEDDDPRRSTIPLELNGYDIVVTCYLKGLAEESSAGSQAFDDAALDELAFWTEFERTYYSYCSHTPQVYSIAYNWSKANTPSHRLIVDNREKTKARTGKPWYGNEEDAQFLWERARDQRKVTCESRFTDYEAIIEEMSYIEAPYDGSADAKNRYHEGLISVILREVV